MASIQERRERLRQDAAYNAKVNDRSYAPALSAPPYAGAQAGLAPANAQDDSSGYNIAQRRERLRQGAAYNAWANERGYAPASTAPTDTQAKPAPFGAAMSAGFGVEMAKAAAPALAGRQDEIRLETLRKRAEELEAQYRQVEQQASRSRYRKYGSERDEAGELWRAARDEYERAAAEMGLTKPTFGERILKTLSGAGKQYLGSTWDAAGAVMPNGTAMGEVYHEQLESLYGEKQRTEEWLKQPEDEQERRQLENRLASINEQIAVYEASVRANEGVSDAARDAAAEITQSGAADLERAKYGAGKAGQLLVDAGAAAAQMAGDAALGYLTGFGSMAPMMVRSFGGGAQQAREKGYSQKQQIALGLSSAATEYFSEKLFGGNPVYDSDAGLVSKLVGKITSNETVLEYLASKPAEMLYEGLEEITADLLEPLAEQIIAGQHDEITLEQVIEDGLVGIILAGVGQGGQKIVNTATQGINTRQTGNLFSDMTDVPAFEVSEEDYQRAMQVTNLSLWSKDLKEIAQVMGKTPAQTMKYFEEIVRNYNLARYSSNAQLGRLYQENVREIEREQGAGNAAGETKNAAPYEAAGDVTLVDRVRQAIPELQKMDAATEINGTELPPGDRMVDRLVGFINKIGNKVTRPGFGDVLFSKSRIKNGMVGHGAGQAKVEAFAAVPAVIQNGAQIDYQENWKGRKYDTYTFAAPVIYRGKQTYLGVIVTQDPKDSRYYVHEVVDADGNIIFGEAKPQDLPADGPKIQSGETDTVVNPVVNNTLSQSGQDVNTKTRATDRSSTSHAPDSARLVDISWPAVTPADASIAQNAADVNSPAAQVRPVAEQAHDVRNVEKLTMDMGKAGARVLNDMYDASVPALEYFPAMNEQYQAGLRGEAKSIQNGGVLTAQQQEAAWLAGQADAQAARGGGNTNHQEGKDNGREGVHLRDSGQRAGGAHTGGAVSAVEEGTGRTQGRQADGAAADAGAASLTYGKAVSTASLGIGGGSTEARIRPVTGGETAATRAAKKLAKERGLRLTLFSGDNLRIRQADGSWASVRGYISGDRVFVRADHPVYTAEQLMRHEAGHDMIAKGEVDPDKVRERIAETFGEKQAEAVSQMYADAYYGTGYTAEQIWEEVVCDSLGDMNVFAGRLNETAARALLWETKNAASEQLETWESRGPPEKTDAADTATPPKGPHGRQTASADATLAQDGGDVNIKAGRSNTVNPQQSETGRRAASNKNSIAQNGGDVKLSGEIYSIDETFANEVDEWHKDGMPAGERFVLGSTGAALQGLGAIESDIYMNGDKISRILKDHPEMTLNEIKRIPEVLEDPALILKSKGAGRQGNNSRMVLYGSIKARNGQPVLAVLDLRPRENGFMLEDMQKVNSAYTKDSPAGFVTGSEVMFADEKRTIPLLRQFGLTIASRRLLRNGSIGNISYDGDAVKIAGVPFSDVVELGEAGKLRNTDQKETGAEYTAAAQNGPRSRGPAPVRNSIDQGDGKVKGKSSLYAGKSLTDDSSIYSYRFLTELPDMRITTLPEVSAIKGANGKVDTGKAVASGMRNARNAGAERDGKVFVRNSYTGKQLQITGESIRHGLNGGMNRLLTNARLGAVIGDVVKNAVPVNALHNKAEGVSGTYAMAGYATDSAGREFVAILTVEQRSGRVVDMEAYDMLHAVSGRQKRSERADTKSQGLYPSTNASVSSQVSTKLQGVYPSVTAEISIANVLDAVKSTHQSVLSEDVLAHLGEEKNASGHYTGQTKYSLELEELESLREENKRLREKAEYWKSQTKVTKDWERTVRQDDVDKLARRLVRDYSSKLDVKDVSGRLKKLGEYLVRNGDGINELTWSEVRSRAADMAKDIVNSAEILNDEQYRLYSDLRSYLRETPLILGPEYQTDIADFNDFRKRNRGRLNLKTKGSTNIDQVYEEMSSTWPEFFDAQRETHPVDQLLNIADVLDGLRPVYENPFSYDMNAAAEHVANDIIDGLMGGSVRQASTYADRAIKRERERRISQLQRLKAEYQTREAKRRERASDRQARDRLLRIAKRLQNKKLPAANRALLDQYIGDLDTVAKSMTGRTLEKLTDLWEWYADRKVNDPDFIADPNIEKAIARLSKRHISDLSAGDVAALTDVLLHIENEIRTERKLIDFEDRRDTYHMGEEVIRDVYATSGSKGGLFDRFIVTETLSPLREVRRLTGYVDANPLLRLTQELANGQRRMYDYQMKAEKAAQPFAEDKEFSRMFSGPKAESVEITGWTKDGPATVKITPAMRTSLYLHSLNDQNLKHINDGGITVPDEKLYRKGKLAEAYNRGTTIRLTPTQVRAICGGMTAREKAFARMAHDYFNNRSRAAINEVSEKLKGYSIAQVENYFPINTDTSFTRGDFDSVKFDGSIEGMGFLKDRRNAANPILLRDANMVLEQSIQQHAKYYGLAIPIRNFMKVWGVTKGSFNADGSRNGVESSVQKAVKKQWGGAGYGYIEKMMTDLQSPPPPKNVWAKAFGEIRSSYAGAVLTLNASVAMKQAASYPTAAAVLGWRPLIAAFKDFGRVDLNLIAKYTPLQWYRSKGFSTKELGDLKTANKQLPAVLNWVQGADLLTTRKLWKASEYYVRQHSPKLQRGSDAYYRAVADIYDRVIEETQPNYTTMQRPQLLRSDDSLMSNLAMFKTQPFQNFNILYDAAANLAAKSRQAKNGGSMEALKEARTNFSRAVTSQLAQLAVFAGMTMAWSMFRGKDDKYKDDETGELTLLSVLEALSKDMAGGLLSGVPFGADAWELASSKLFGDRYYGLDAVTVTAITDTVSSLSGMAELIGGGVRSIAAGEEVDWNAARLETDGYFDDISKGFGVPFENVANLFNASYRQVCIAIMGKYRGEYAALKLTTDPEKKPGSYYDLLYQTLKDGKTEDYQAFMEDLMSKGLKASSIESAMWKRMKDDFERDPDYSLYKQAGDLLGARESYGEERESESFTKADLDPEQYRSFSTARAENYRNIADEMEGFSTFQALDSAAKDKALKAASALSGDLALEAASGGEYTADTKWMLWATGGEDAGVSEAEAILFKVAYDMSESDKDPDTGKTVPGSKKENVLEAAAEMMPWLTDRELEYLMGNYWK